MDDRKRTGLSQEQKRHPIENWLMRRELFPDVGSMEFEAGISCTWEQLVVPWEQWVLLAR